MFIIEQPNILNKLVTQWHCNGKHVALIPTMGNIHEGHIALINEGHLYADKVIVSIFINPMQFTCMKDFFIYPRTLQEDYEKLYNLKIDVIFAPTVNTMYPNGINDHSIVDVVRFSHILDGMSRSRHFQGVATVVSKLFNIIQPQIVCFGEKDYQQLILIRQLIYDMNYNIKVINVPIIRDKDGLPFSSRNIHLTTEERRIAPYLYKILQNLANKLRKNKLLVKDSLKLTKEQLICAGFKPEHINICDADTLQEITTHTTNVVVLISVLLGNTRLIDNIKFNFSS